MGSSQLTCTDDHMKTGLEENFSINFRANTTLLNLHNAINTIVHVIHELGKL